MTSQPPHNDQDTIMHAANFRLSRLSHPRATLWAIALLTAVFLGFGLWVEAAVQLPAVTP